MSSISMGEFIAEKRKEKQMTQQNLADLLHISNKTVSKWESGRSMPDVAILSALAESLGVGASELLSAGESAAAKPETRARETLAYFVRKKLLSYRIAKIIFTMAAVAGIFSVLIPKNDIYLFLFVGCLLSLLSFSGFLIARTVTGSSFKQSGISEGSSLEPPHDLLYCVLMVWLWLYPLIFTLWMNLDQNILSNLLINVFAQNLTNGEIISVGSLRCWILICALTDAVLLVTAWLLRRRRGKEKPAGCPLD